MTVASTTTAARLGFRSRRLPTHHRVEQSTGAAREQNRADENRVDATGQQQHADEGVHRELSEKQPTNWTRISRRAAPRAALAGPACRRFVSHTSAAVGCTRMNVRIDSTASNANGARQPAALPSDVTTARRAPFRSKRHCRRSRGPDRHRPATPVVARIRSPTRRTARASRRRPSGPLRQSANAGAAATSALLNA